MEFTGERYVPELDLGSEISIYHFQRYMGVVELARGKDVLDAASGEGYGSNILADVARSVKGIDISPEAVANAIEKYKKENLEYKVASVEKLPFEDDSFDLVVSYETIEHVPEDVQKAFLNEISRVLRPNGILVMSSPDKKNYSDIPKFNNEFHVHEMYYDEFNDLLSAHFSNIQMYYQGMTCDSYVKNISEMIPDKFNTITIKEPEDWRAEYIIAVCSNAQVDIDLTNVIPDCVNRYYRMNDELNDLKSSLGNPANIIEQKENYINEQRQIISGRDNEIREIKGIVEQKENYINEQRQIISNRDNEIREIKGVIEQKENYINEQRLIMSQKDNEIEQKDNEIEQKNLDINHLYTEISRLTNIINQQSDMLIDADMRFNELNRKACEYEDFLVKRGVGRVYNLYRNHVEEQCVKMQTVLKIAILNPYVATLGGGEKHMGYLCQFLEEYYADRNVQIDILVHDYNDVHVHDDNYITMDDINKQFGLNLVKTQLRKLDFPVPNMTHEILEQRYTMENITAEYDIFINFMFQSKHIGKAKYNIYECMFPPVPMGPLYRNEFEYLQREEKHDKDFIDSYNLFITNSEYTDYWTDYRWDTLGKQLVIYPPVFSLKEIEGKYEENKKKNIIISVGRFFVGSHSKKQLDLVKFFVNNQDVFEDYEYHLCGAVATLGADREYLEEIRQVASKVNNVFIHENCPFDELMELYSQAKIFWHATGYGVNENKEPEKMEHFGITPVEAMSYGAIPVVINKGGPRETVEEGVNGFRWNTEEECVEKTRRLIENDALRRKMAVICAEKAKSYSIEKFYERHKRVFDEIHV